MASAHSEVERAFRPPPEAGLPDLTALSGVARVGEPEQHGLVATYYDTPDLALLRRGVTLRRRTGGPDEGWHLKVPSSEADSRDEVRLPLDDAGDNADGPPAELAGLVTGWTRGVAVAPVAEVQTERAVRRLMDDSGQVLAELTDDRVVGRQSTPGAAPVAWREWELELVDGDRDLLDELTDLFEDDGVDISPLQRKLEAVLGSGVAPADVGEIGLKHPASRVLHRRLLDEVEMLARHDHTVRRNGDEGIHEMRKACRRLRSALATYRPLVDRSKTDPIREELRWLARAMGDARDSQVVHGRLAALLDDQPDDVVVGPVRERVEQAGAEQGRIHRREVLEILGSDRYLELLRALDRLAADPPWADGAHEPTADVVPKRIRKDWKRLKRRYKRAEDARGAGDRAGYDTALHDVRKAAKRLRYACEAVEQVWGSDAEDLRDAAKEITQVLGTRQDTVVARHRLIELADEATEAGESTFTYGRLHAVEEHASQKLTREFEDAWTQARRKKLRAWLS